MGARLPESEAEMQAFAAVAYSVVDCIRPESSPEVLVADMRRWMGGLRVWWEGRNKRSTGEGARGSQGGVREGRKGGGLHWEVGMGTLVSNGDM